MHFIVSDYSQQADQDIQPYSEGCSQVRQLIDQCRPIGMQLFQASMVDVQTPELGYHQVLSFLRPTFC